MLLSIIVISHNQRDLLKRCIDSILTMPLSFDHEIIISDDASIDGTWELAQEYALRYPEISAYQCNTDDYNPSIKSERSGWNRCNAYKYAKGKYIAHVDGDDFFIDGTDVYKRQVELLELHPECSCCMSKYFSLNDGEDLSSAVIPHKERFETGYVLPSKEYVAKLFRESHVFVYRRNPQINPVSLYGGYYADSVITYHHLQFGDIVCLDEAGYVYVHYQSSIWRQMTKSEDYKLFLPALQIPHIIPKWKYVFYSEPLHLKRILNVVWLASSGHILKEDNSKRIKKIKSYLFGTFNRKLNLFDKLLLWGLSKYIILLLKWNPSIKMPYRILALFI